MSFIYANYSDELSRAVKEAFEKSDPRAKSPYEFVCRDGEQIKFDFDEKAWVNADGSVLSAHAIREILLEEFGV